MSNEIGRARSAITDADALLFTAGAGMGVDSGLPDFRGREGFWRAYPVIAKLGLRFEEVANPRWFVDDPELAWAFYGHRLNLYRKTEPHAGFKMLLELGRAKMGGYFVFTSNVDGHFQRSGFDENRVVECHGSIHHLQCVSSCCGEIWSADESNVVVDEEKFRAEQPLPMCRRCGGLARPNILMFNDYDWLPGRSEAQMGRLQKWIALLEKSGAKLAVIEIGAGTAVPSVRMLSEEIAERSDRTLIRINPREPAVPDGGVALATGGLAGIQLICGV